MSTVLNSRDVTVAKDGSGAKEAGPAISGVGGGGGGGGEGSTLVPTRPTLSNADSAAQFLSKSQEQMVISQTTAETGLGGMPDPLVLLNESGDGDHPSGSTFSNLEVVEEAATLEESVFEHHQQRPRSISLSAPASSGAVFSATCNAGDSGSTASSSSSYQDEPLKGDSTGSDKDKGQCQGEGRDRLPTPPPKMLPVKQKLPVNSSRTSKLRSNSPKPTKTSKLVTEEATENSLSLEEANRITGMRILLAEGKVLLLCLSFLPFFSIAQECDTH